MMLEWPGRCNRCHEVILEWGDTGLFHGHWIHKACWSYSYRESAARGRELPALRSPLERATQLELPMLIFVLLFHFGLGAAVIGWIMITQDGSDTTGTIVLAGGLVTPLIGVIGVVLNVISRRRLELIRRELDADGGWKPGR